MFGERITFIRKFDPGESRLQIHQRNGIAEV